MHKRAARRNLMVAALGGQALYWGARGVRLHKLRAAYEYNSRGEHAVMKRGTSTMGKLTTHVLNVAAGIPAVGMRVELSGGSAPVPARAVFTDKDGRCGPSLLDGEAFRPGRYSLTFQVAAYFRSLGMALPEPPFLDEVVIAFGIADAGQNYHVPLLVSPWSYSTYRGS